MCYTRGISTTQRLTATCWVESSFYYFTHGCLSYWSALCFSFVICKMGMIITVLILKEKIRLDKMMCIKFFKKSWCGKCLINCNSQEFSTGKNKKTKKLELYIKRERERGQWRFTINHGLMWLQRLQSPMICHLQAGDLGKPVGSFSTRLMPGSEHCWWYKPQSKCSSRWDEISSSSSEKAKRD